MKIDKKIIKEEEVCIRGITYNQITFEDGEQILHRYNEKSKMWIELIFKPNGYDDSKTVEEIRSIMTEALVYGFQWQKRSQ